MPALIEEIRPPLARREALIEADRCLECGEAHAAAPCMLACPAGVDVPRFVAALAAGDTDAAARTILAANLLGASCARVCPVEVLCEAGCVLVHEGRAPIEIGLLQRFALEQSPPTVARLRPRLPANGRAVAVIGAGPAGLACAGELALRGYAVTVHDGRAEAGGLARYAIAPYRLDREPLPQEAHMLEELGVELRFGEPVTDRGALERIAAGVDAVFLGLGMGADSDASVPGDDLEGVWDSLPFIEALKTGALTSIDGAVAVIGGGNTAIDVACESARLGAPEVTMIYRRTRAEMPAYAHEADLAEREGVRFEWLAAPVRFLGERHVEGVECIRMRLGDPDDSGRRRPEPVPGSEFVLPARTVVRAIGQRGRPELAQWIDGLELDGGRLVVEPETGRTGNPKFFAGGDVINGGASVVEAVRDGMRAARAIDEWLACAS